MANSERARMLELGQWLQVFLNPNIQVSDYKKLAQKAIDYYNFDLIISKSDISLMVIDQINKFPIETQEALLNLEKRAELGRLFHALDWFGLESKFPLIPEPNLNSFSIIFDHYEEIVDIIMNSELVFSDKNFLLAYLTLLEKSIKPIYSFYKQKKSIPIEIEVGLFQNQLFNFSDYKRPINYLLQNINSNVPWYEFFNDLLKESWKNHEKFNLRNYHERFNLQNTANLLCDAYNSMTNHLVFENGYPIKKNKNSFFPLEYKTSIGTVSCIPWDIFSSKIVLDFLILGGQDHFKFCEYCGAFTVIRRKDSKKFCSNRCRAHHHLYEIAKSE